MTDADRKLLLALSAALDSDPFAAAVRVFPGVSLSRDLARAMERRMLKEKRA